MAAYLGYTADEDAVLWLTSDQLWLMTRIREEEEKEVNRGLLQTIFTPPDRQGFVSIGCVKKQRENIHNFASIFQHGVVIC